MIRPRAEGCRVTLAGGRGRELLDLSGGFGVAALERGVLLIPAGRDSELIQAAPPLTIADAGL